MKIKKGEKLPLAEFFYLNNTGPQKIKSTELLENQKAIIIGVPGAFTKICSAKHLPGYVKNYEAAKKKRSYKNYLYFSQRPKCDESMG